MRTQTRGKNVLQLPGIFGKTWMPTPMPLAPQLYREFDPATGDIDSETVDRAIKPESLSHDYAIKALEKSGLFNPRPYLYICVRCRYSFIVNESRGSIVAVDRGGKPLPERENSRRIKTFAEGPCPAFRFLKRRARPTMVMTQPSKFVRALARVVSFLLWRLAHHPKC
jgi:hypothetical protein